MDVDARGSEDHLDPVMIQEQALTEIGVKPPPDPWSGWARLADVPSHAEEVETDLVADDTDREAPPPREAAPAAAPAPVPPNDDLVTAVARLAAELADERRLRS